MQPKWDKNQAIIVTGIFILIFLSSCAPAAGNSSTFNKITPTASLNVKLDKPAQPVMQDVRQPELISLPNCAGKSVLKKLFGDIVHVAGNYLVGENAKNDAGSAVPIPPATRLQLAGEVKNGYQDIYAKAAAQLNSISMDAAPGVTGIFTIQWQQMDYKAFIHFSSGNETLSADYTFSLLTPRIVSNKTVSCSADSAPRATASTPEVSTVSSRPATDADLETMPKLWDLTQMATLYGPGTMNYNISIKRSQEYQWGASWCGESENNLKEVLAPLELNLIVNGAVIPAKNIHQYDNIEAGRYCHHWVTLLSNWNDMNDLELRYSINYQVFDGLYLIYPGQYFHIITAEAK